MVAISSLFIITPFNPLLLQTLLSNSWTWLLLSLATIATTVFRTTRFPRPPAPPHILPSPSAPSFIPRSALPKRHRRSKSTSSLTKLAPHHHNLDRLNLVSGLEIISSFFDDSLVPRTLRQVASVSRLYDCLARQLGDKGTNLLGHDLGFRGFLGLANETKNAMNDETKEGWEGIMDGCTKKPQRQLSYAEDSSKHALPSLFQAPSHDYYVRSPPSTQPSLCFEKQFGWDKVLETKLGMEWGCPNLARTKWVEKTGEDEIHIPQLPIVREWSSNHMRLLETLEIDASSIVASDVGSCNDGLVSFAHVNGEVSLWDIASTKCTKHVSAHFLTDHISSLFTNSEKGLTIARNGNVISLFDKKSPTSMQLSCSLWNPNILPTFNEMPQLANLESKGNSLYIPQAGGLFSMFDMRKLCGESSCIGLLPWNGALNQKEESVGLLWDNLTYMDAEDDFEDECYGYTSHQNASFMSRCLDFVTGAW